MYRCVSVFVSLLLAGCTASSGSRVAPYRDLHILVPVPTQVQFFSSPKPVSVYAGQKDGAFPADLRFKMVDAAGKEDYFGDDDQTLGSNVNLSANQVGTFSINVPIHRRTNGTPDAAADIDVDYPYRTTQLWFTASVGGKYPGAPAMVVVDDPAHDDIMGATVKVKFVSLSAGKTRIDVTVDIKDGNANVYSRTGSTQVGP